MPGADGLEVTCRSAPGLGSAPHSHRLLLRLGRHPKRGSWAPDQRLCLKAPVQIHALPPSSALSTANARTTAGETPQATLAADGSCWWRTTCSSARRSPPSSYPRPAPRWTALLTAPRAVRNLPSPLPATDLILMDVQMPVMNGYEVTCRIRALPRKTPAHHMTADADTKSPGGWHGRPLPNCWTQLMPGADRQREGEVA